MDGNLFRNDLENNLIPIANEFSSSCITRENFDLHFAKLLTAISDVIDKHAPLHTVSRKQKRIQIKPWLTKNLLVSLKTKQCLYRSCFLNGTDFDKLFYKTCAHKLTRVKALAKKLYFGSAIAAKKDNPKELWKLIKTVANTKALSNINSFPQKII